MSTTGKPVDPAAAMWDGGDYRQMATLLEPAAAAVATVVDAEPGGPVLDLGAGTGSATVAVAASGRHVDAVDIAPGLVALGRQRCEHGALDTTWHVGRFDQLDLVLGLRDDYAAAMSSFGLIFAPDPVATLTDVVRRLRPGGLVALAVWDAEGYIASMTRAMTQVMPAQSRPAVLAWTRWGVPATTTDWLRAAGLDDVEIAPAGLPWRFASARTAVDFLFTCSPGHVAASGAAADGGAMLRTVVLEHLMEQVGTHDPNAEVDLSAAYQVVTARRPR